MCLRAIVFSLCFIVFLLQAAQLVLYQQQKTRTEEIGDLFPEISHRFVCANFSLFIEHEILMKDTKSQLSWFCVLILTTNERIWRDGANISGENGIEKSCEQRNIAGNRDFLFHNIKFVKDILLTRTNNKKKWSNCQWRFSLSFRVEPFIRRNFFFILKSRYDDRMEISR